MLLRPPILPLQPYIETIWYCNRYIDTPETTISLPFGRIELVINITGEYKVKYPDLPEVKMDNWVSGQQSAPILNKISGQHECMGVVFTLLGYNALTKMPASEFANSYISADDIFGGAISTLKTQLFELKSPEEKLTHLETILLRRVTVQPELSTIRQALYLIHTPEHKKKITVANLCGTLKVSRNALNKHFRRYIGIPASVYLQVNLFNSVIRKLGALPKERLVSIGYDHDFFDQSHFIRHFRQFAGMAPGQYTRLLNNDAIDKTFPNFISC